MQDIELYRQLLGLNSPWTVSRVELRVKEQRVEVWAEHADGARWACSECAVPLALYDHAEERVWRHLALLSHGRVANHSWARHFRPNVLGWSDMKEVTGTSGRARRP